MPPEPMPQPDDKDRAAAAALDSFLNSMPMRKSMTAIPDASLPCAASQSGEYAYAILDLTGLNLDSGDRRFPAILSAARVLPTSATCSLCRMSTWNTI